MAFMRDHYIHNIGIIIIIIIIISGLNAVGVQCPSLPHEVSFPAIGIGSGVLGFRPYWCPSPFPSPSILDVFHLLFLPLDFNRVSSLRPTYRHPFGRPFTYSLLGEFPGLGLALVPDVVVPKAEQRCTWSRHGAENSIQISALVGVEPRTLASSGRGCATRLPRTPPFSRLLRHAGGYSRTILTPNLHTDKQK